VALQILLNDTYKLNHCKAMGAEPGSRFLIQPVAKLEPVIVTPNLRRVWPFGRIFFLTFFREGCSPAARLDEPPLHVPVCHKMQKI